ncbi:MAG TPA: ABC transporter permease [Mycobacteriales bacterium]|jgi:NitT/TauT family transport system permease protein|nr:ABC transporter permease [Mycobacteriales bacterium]
MIESTQSPPEAGRRRPSATGPQPRPPRPAILIRAAQALRRVEVWLPAVVALALAAGAWQWYAIDHKYVIPQLQQIFGQLWDRPDFYWRNMLVTLRESVVGAGCGVGAAFLLAVIMTHVRVVERALMPLAIIVNVTPVIAVAPGLVVAFGFGLTPKYIITAVIVFFPFLINALVGLRSVDRMTLAVFRTLHASTLEILWRLRLPSSVPFLFAAARICLPLSVIGAVAAEFVAAGEARGLGTVIATSASTSDLRTIYASVFTLSLLGLVLSALVVLLERCVMAWHGSTNRPH